MNGQSTRLDFDEALEGADPHLLVCSSRLLTFYTAELARYAKVDLNAVRMFIEQNTALFHDLGVECAPGDNLWQLRPEIRDEVAARAAKFVCQGLHSNHDEGADMTTMPVALDLLEETLDDLVGGCISDPSERSMECELARIYLNAAEANVRDRKELSLPIDDTIEFRIESARKKLAMLVKSADNEQSIRRPGLRRYELSFLLDWVSAGSKVSGSDRNSTDSSTLAFMIDSLLQIAFERQHPMGVESALHMLAMPQIDIELGIHEDKLPIMIRQRLAQPIASHSAFAALAILAAVLDDADSAQPLFAAVLTSGSEVLGPDEYKASLLALSWLARPRVRLATGNVKAAAACSYILSSMKELPAEHVALLAPAAMCSPNSKAGEILRMAAEAIFDQDGIKSCCAMSVNEEALMHNFALALFSQAFAPLKQNMAELLRSCHGTAFVRSLCDPQHHAIIITDANETDFCVRADKALYEFIEADEIKPFPLKIRKSSRDGLVLNAIIREHRRAETRQEIRSENTGSEEAPKLPTFSKLLKQRRHADRDESNPSKRMGTG